MYKRQRQNRNERQERSAEKPPREASTVTTATPAEQRQERRPRNERKERRERQAPETQEKEALLDTSLPLNLVTSTPLAETQVTTETAENSTTGNEEQGTRRRGRRGGRGRGDRRQDNEAQVQVADNQTGEVTASTEATLAPEVQNQVVVEVTPQPAMTEAVVPELQVPIDAAPIETPAPAVLAPPALVLEPEPIAAITPPPVLAHPMAIDAPAPAAPTLTATSVNEKTSPVSVTEQIVVNAEVTAETPVALPAVDINQALADSGLVMVQTATSMATPVVAAEPVKLGRPRKPRTAPVAETEALVMVETTTQP